MTVPACPFCESANVRTLAEQDEHEIDGHKVMVPAQSQAQACDACGAIFGNGADMRVNASAMRAASLRVRKLMTSAEAQSVREPI